MPKEGGGEKRGRARGRERKGEKKKKKRKENSLVQGFFFLLTCQKFDVCNHTVLKKKKKEGVGG